MQTPSVGRILHYQLTAQDAEQINRRRTTGKAIAERIPDGKWPLGAQAHIGNEAGEGQVLPLIVVRDNGGSVNGQVLLDGNDAFWVTSKAEGSGPGFWCWPPRT